MNLLSPRKLAPVPLYLIMMGAAEMFMITYGIVASVYRIQEAGLNPLQLVLVGTVLEASVFLFEVPTGVVADVYSRRLSIIIGFVLVGAGFIVEGLFPLFGVILVGQVIWGVGYTFTSGATQAWISDETGGQRVGRIYLRGEQAAQVGALAGIGIGVALGTFALGLPLVVGGSLMLGLAVFLIVFMPEQGFTRTPSQERESWKTMATTLRAGLNTVRLRPVLATIIVITVIYGAASEPIDRLWPMFLLTNFEFPAFEPVIWFGIIGAVSRVIGIGATEIVQRYFDIDDRRTIVRVLFVLNSLHIASIVVVALAGNFALAVSIFLVSGVVRRINDPVMDAWTNQHTDSSVRATVFSLRGQGDALGQITFGPVMGALATITTIRIALLGVAAMLVPPQALYILVGRKNDDDS